MNQEYTRQDDHSYINDAMVQFLINQYLKKHRYFVTYRAAQEINGTLKLERAQERIIKHTINYIKRNKL